MLLNFQDCFKVWWCRCWSTVTVRFARIRQLFDVANEGNEIGITGQNYGRGIDGAS